MPKKKSPTIVTSEKHLFFANRKAKRTALSLNLITQDATPVMLAPLQATRNQDGSTSYTKDGEDYTPAYRPALRHLKAKKY